MTHYFYLPALPQYIKSFYNEICQKLDGDYKIILEPGRDLRENWIEYDTLKWEMEDKIKDYAKLLYDQALLIEGFEVEDPIAFSNKICELMIKANQD